MEHDFFGSGTTWIATEGECNSGRSGEIVINEGGDVEQNKGPILLYNTIRKVSSDYLYCVSV